MMNRSAAVNHHPTRVDEEDEEGATVALLKRSESVLTTQTVDEDSLIQENEEGRITNPTREIESENNNDALIYTISNIIQDDNDVKVSQTSDNLKAKGSLRESTIDKTVNKKHRFVRGRGGNFIKKTNSEDDNNDIHFNNNNNINKLNVDNLKFNLNINIANSQLIKHNSGSQSNGNNNNNNNMNVNQIQYQYSNGNSNSNNALSPNINIRITNSVAGTQTKLNHHTDAQSYFIDKLPDPAGALKNNDYKQELLGINIDVDVDDAEAFAFSWMSIDDCMASSVIGMGGFINQSQVVQKQLITASQRNGVVGGGGVSTGGIGASIRFPDILEYYKNERFKLQRIVDGNFNDGGVQLQIDFKKRLIKAVKQVQKEHVSFFNNEIRALNAFRLSKASEIDEVSLRMLDFDESNRIFSQKAGFINFKQLHALLQSKQLHEKYPRELEFFLLKQLYFLLRKLGAMHAVHRIAHSDIKPNNIVLGFDLLPYFIDFGGSILIDTEIQKYMTLCTPAFIHFKFIQSPPKTKQDVINCDHLGLILSFLLLLCRTPEENRLFFRRDYIQLLRQFREFYSQPLIDFFNQVLLPEGTTRPLHYAHFLPAIKSILDSSLVSHMTDIASISAFLKLLKPWDYTRETDTYTLHEWDEFNANIFKHFPHLHFHLDLFNATPPLSSRAFFDSITKPDVNLTINPYSNTYADILNLFMLNAAGLPSSATNIINASIVAIPPSPVTNLILNVVADYINLASNNQKETTNYFFNTMNSNSNTNNAQQQQQQHYLLSKLIKREGTSLEATVTSSTNQIPLDLQPISQQLKHLTIRSTSSSEQLPFKLVNLLSSAPSQLDSLHIHVCDISLQDLETTLAFQRNLRSLELYISEFSYKISLPNHFAKLQTLKTNLTISNIAEILESNRSTLEELAITINACDESLSIYDFLASSESKITKLTLQLQSYKHLAKRPIIGIGAAGTNTITVSSGVQMEIPQNHHNNNNPIMLNTQTAMTSTTTTQIYSRVRYNAPILAANFYRCIATIHPALLALALDFSECDSLNTEDIALLLKSIRSLNAAQFSHIQQQNNHNYYPQSPKQNQQLNAITKTMETLFQGGSNTPKTTTTTTKNQQQPPINPNNIHAIAAQLKLSLALNLKLKSRPLEDVSIKNVLISLLSATCRIPHISIALGNSKSLTTSSTSTMSMASMLLMKQQSFLASIFSNSSLSIKNPYIHSFEFDLTNVPADFPYQALVDHLPKCSKFTFVVHSKSNNHNNLSTSTANLFNNNNNMNNNQYIDTINALRFNNSNAVFNLQIDDNNGINADNLNGFINNPNVFISNALQQSESAMMISQALFMGRNNSNYNTITNNQTSNNSYGNMFIRSLGTNGLDALEERAQISDFIDFNAKKLFSVSNVQGSFTPLETISWSIGQQVTSTSSSSYSMATVGLFSILETLKTNEKLTTLCIDFSQFAPISTPALFSHFFESLKYNKSISTVNVKFSETQLQSPLKSFYSCLSFNDRLTGLHLNLNSCDLVADDLVDIAEGIVANEFVHEYSFDFTGNPRIFDASTFFNAIQKARPNLSIVALFDSISDLNQIFLEIDANAANIQQIELVQTSYEAVYQEMKKHSKFFNETILELVSSHSQTPTPKAAAPSTFSNTFNQGISSNNNGYSSPALRGLNRRNMQKISTMAATNNTTSTSSTSRQNTPMIKHTISSPSPPLILKQTNSKKQQQQELLQMSSPSSMQISSSRYSRDQQTPGMIGLSRRTYTSNSTERLNQELSQRKLLRKSNTKTNMMTTSSQSQLMNGKMATSMNGVTVSSSSNSSSSNYSSMGSKLSLNSPLFFQKKEMVRDFESVEMSPLNKISSNNTRGGQNASSRPFIMNLDNYSLTSTISQQQQQQQLQMQNSQSQSLASPMLMMTTSNERNPLMNSNSSGMLLFARESKIIKQYPVIYAKSGGGEKNEETNQSSTLRLVTVDSVDLKACFNGLFLAQRNKGITSIRVHVPQAECASSLSASLRESANVERLSVVFAENAFTGPAEVASLVELLSSVVVSNKVESLSISARASKIGVAALKMIVFQIRKSKVLKEISLDFSENMLQPKAGSVLASMISGMPQLEKLDLNLNKNFLGAQGFSAICEVLGAARNQIRSTAVTQGVVPLVNGIGSERVAGIMQVPKMKVFTLQVESNFIHDAAIESLHRVVEENNQLEELHLHLKGNQIKSEALGSIKAILTYHQSIKQFSLKLDRNTTNMNAN